MATIGRPRIPLNEQFWNRVELGDKPDDCWRWTGYINPQGHGSLRVTRKGHDTNLKAHQLALSLIGKEQPAGYDIHHVCENRWCVNPDHLELMTHGEHKRLHLGDRCPQGHSKTPENTYYYKGGPYGCRLCRNSRSGKRVI